MIGKTFPTASKTFPATYKTFPATSKTFPNIYICTCGKLGPSTKSDYLDKYSKGEVYILSYYYYLHVFCKIMRIVQFSIAFCNPQSPYAQREYMLHLDAGFRKWKS